MRMLRGDQSRVRVRVPEPTTMAPRTQIHALTGLRGFAAVWVALHHALAYLDNEAAVPAYIVHFIEYGWTAVDLFFVLSGFVISYVHRSDFPSLASDQYFRFFKTRLARIYPAHFVALLLWLPVLIAARALVTSQESTAATAPFTLRTFLFAATLMNGWGLPGSTGWNGPSWSVGAEWFAYLCFPVLTVSLARLKSVRGNLLAIVAIIGGMTAIGYIASDGQQYMLPPSATLARVTSEFAIGCCVFSIYSLRRNARANNFLAVGATLAVLTMTATDVPPIYVFALIGLFAVLVLGLTSGTSVVHRALSSPIAVYLGRISYSVYLVHYLVLVIARRLANMLIPDGNPVAGDWLFTSLYIPGFLIAGHLLFTLVEEPARIFLRRAWVDRRDA